MDEKRLETAASRLGEAALDPTVWPAAMEEICRAVGATGAALLQSDVRTADIPRTAGVVPLFNGYFADGWHTRDVRAIRGAPLLLRGERVVIDQDMMTPDEIRRNAFYCECLSPHGFQWFAGVGFRAGSALWALCIQRTPREGPFEAPEKRALAQLSERLTETATLARAVGEMAIASTTNALNLVGQPAVAVDRAGAVLDMNVVAERLFDDQLHVKNRRVFVRDQRARSVLDTLVARLRALPHNAALAADPIVIRREGKPPILIRVLPVDGPASTPFLGARALLTLSELGPKPALPAGVLTRAFSLTRAEARLASLIAAGISPSQAAEELGIARETARNQLKAVFAKTGAHRQAELVALLSRL
jgi:DNA-binding CsgD family transcriptional regulator